MRSQLVLEVSHEGGGEYVLEYEGKLRSVHADECVT